jgi:hypothetical protein
MNSGGGTYAKETRVSVETSRAEIERTLARYGANAFSYGWEEGRAVVAFRAHGRMIRFDIPTPALEEFRLTPTRMRRGTAEARSAQEKATRQRWRALLLIVKAKLEAVETGVTTFEQEFLAHVLLPDGRTFGEWAGPELDQAYTSGSMPPSLLPGVRSGELPAGGM